MVIKPKHEEKELKIKQIKKKAENKNKEEGKEISGERESIKE